MPSALRPLLEAPIAGGQINSAVSRGRVNCGLSTYGSGRGTSPSQANEGTVS
jgi:hypothetical protein